MIVLVLTVAIVISVPLLGGKFSRLVQVEFEETWLVIFGFMIQMAVVSVAPRELETIAEAVHLASYLLAGGFLVVNLHIPGLWILGLGGGMNFAAIVANGGTMPAGRWATQISGLVQAEGEFANSGMVEHPKLLFLGDIFPIPAGWPLSNVFSIGDVLLVIGAGVVLHSLSGSRLSRAYTSVAAGGGNTVPKPRAHVSAS